MRGIALFFFWLSIAWCLPAHAQVNPGNPVASVQSATASASLVAKASAGLLYGFQASSAGSAGYVLIFDATSVPANGTVTPKHCYPVAASQPVSGSWVQYPEPYVNGIVFEFSTTGCYSATSSATGFFSAQVK